MGKGTEVCLWSVFGEYRKQIAWCVCSERGSADEAGKVDPARLRGGWYSRPRC